ncbi:MAG TPA: CARDB domain-containing protein, partial [Pirellulales bacterium]
QLAEQIVDESSQGDAFTLVLLADPPQVIVGSPSFAPADFVKEIANLKLTHGGGDLAATLVRVEEILHSARREYPRLAQEQIFFLTDLGRTSWAPDLAKVALDEFRERSRRLGESASLTLIDLGQPNAENMAIEQLRIDEPLVTVGQPVSLSAEVRNFGRQPRGKQTVELLVDGRRAAEQTVDVAPGGRASLSFSHPFETPGDHVAELKLAADSLEVDNRRYLALPVKEQIRVLCVDGRPAGVRFKSSTDFLTVALAPREAEGQAPRLKTEVVSESALLDSDLTKFDCVFLCDVAQFTEREAKILRSYLNWGGGLVFFLGEQVVADSYNRQLGPAAGPERRVLPAALGAVVAEPHYGLDPLGYRHPLVAEFRDQEQAGLLTTPVSKFFQLQLSEKSQAQVALAIENGAPLIVEEPIGRGRSILIATSAEASWTAMPMWPSYVPIVQELLMFAVRGQLQDRNVLVGQSLGALLPPGAGNTVEIQLPGGEVKRNTAGGAGGDRSWSFAETTTSGIFRAQSAAANGGAPLVESFAVNVDTAESDLTPVSEDELAREIWPGVRYLHRTNWANDEGAVDAEIVSRSHLHLWLIWLAGGLLLVESFLNWFTGRHAQ